MHVFAKTQQDELILIEKIENLFIYVDVQNFKLKYETDVLAIYETYNKATFEFEKLKTYIEKVNKQSPMFDFPRYFIYPLRYQLRSR
jgi:hypothetical protein